MKYHSVRFLLPLTLSLFMLACSPARTGVVNTTLTTNSQPGVSITANPPLELKGSGMVWVSAPTNIVASTASARFSYALFSSTPSGPLKNSGHAIIMRLDNSDQWRFQPDSGRLLTFLRVGRNSPNAFGMGNNLLRIPSAGDWVSDVWRANGYEVPEFWLAKRWVTPLNNSTRAVAEYREPWPACADNFMQTPFVSLPEECLSDFFANSGNAFDVTRVNTPLPEQLSGPTLIMPASRPDTERLVGDVLDSARNLPD